MNTTHLCIRELTPDDWPSLKRIVIDFAQSPYHIYDHPFPHDDESLQALTRQFAASHLWFAVCLCDSSEMIGYVCFHRDGDRFDLGYCFHSAYHGRGYAYEACAALMAELARTYGAITFTAGTALDNTPSCRLLEKLGFVLTSTEPVSFCRDDAGNDIIFTGGSFIRR